MVRLDRMPCHARTRSSVQSSRPDTVPDVRTLWRLGLRLQHCVDRARRRGAGARGEVVCCSTAERVGAACLGPGASSRARSCRISRANPPTIKFREPFSAVHPPREACGLVARDEVPRPSRRHSGRRPVIDDRLAPVRTSTDGRYPIVSRDAARWHARLIVRPADVCLRGAEHSFNRWRAAGLARDAVRLFALGRGGADREGRLPRAEEISIEALKHSSPCLCRHTHRPLAPPAAR